MRDHPSTDNNTFNSQVAEHTDGQESRPTITHTFSSDIKRGLLPLKMSRMHVGDAFLRGMGQILEDFIIIVLAALLCRLSWLLYPASLVLIGCRQRGLADILHQSAHHTLARNRVANVVLGTICSGYLVFQLFIPYRVSHVKHHHPNLGHPVKDPDMRQHVADGLYDVPDWHTFKHRHVLRPLLGAHIPSYLGYVLRDRLCPSSSPQHTYMGWTAVQELRVFLVYWLFLLLVGYLSESLWILVLFWVVPYATSFQIVGYMIELSEHYPIKFGQAALLQTRNRNGREWERWLTGIHQENYHLVHHLDPSIPSWNLESAHHVMLQDEQYRMVNERYGGLFTKLNPRQLTFFEQVRESLA
jgi:fatty acid desaturase